MVQMYTSSLHNPTVLGFCSIRRRDGMRIWRCATCTWLCTFIMPQGSTLLGLTVDYDQHVGIEVAHS